MAPGGSTAHPSVSATATAPGSCTMHAGVRAHVARWQTEAVYAPGRAWLDAWLENASDAEIADAFGRHLRFGTGGMRGQVGLGPNRVNPWTVAASVVGHVQWLRRRYGADTVLDVAVAYDVRRLSMPWGEAWSSRGFAELAARLFASMGCRAWLPKADQPLVSTPELSFLIRANGCVGGINLTASHNPPTDNGIKVYDDRGAQLVAPDDQTLLEVIEKTVLREGFLDAEATGGGCVATWSNAQRDAWLDAVTAAHPPGPRGGRVVYTRLHGTGRLDEFLDRVGHDCALYAPQANPDGRFPTIADGCANPEDADVLAQAVADAGDADLVLGTDPDADRIGAAVAHGGGWRVLSGNDIACLVVDTALASYCGSRRPLVVTTETTTRLIRPIAESHGAVVVDDRLVGFKNIAALLAQFERDGSAEGWPADALEFVVGVEESHGVLVGASMRDKDAATGALALAQRMSAERVHGRTLVDALEALRARHGAFASSSFSVGFATTDLARRRMADLRDEVPPTVGGVAVQRVIDHLDVSGRWGPFRSTSDRLARDVIVVVLEPGPFDEGTRWILRPSGTEPKIKHYVEVLGRSGLNAEQRVAVERRRRCVEDAIRELGATASLVQERRRPQPASSYTSRGV